MMSQGLALSALKPRRQSKNTKVACLRDVRLYEGAPFVRDRCINFIEDGTKRSMEAHNAKATATERISSCLGASAVLPATMRP
jgi:hypothetical protein